MLLAQTTPTTGTEPAIPPVVWEVVDITAPSSSPLEITDPERYTVQFQPKGTLAAKAECNQVVGTYTAENSLLDITLSDPPLARCPSDVQSDQFLELLDAATAFAIDSDGFLNLQGEQGRLRLRSTLVGVVWEWQDFRGGDDSLLAPADPRDYTLTFMPDGHLLILAGCSRTQGTYTVEGPVLQLAFDTPVRAGCRPGSLAERYLRDLGDVSSHVFRDGNLYLALRADAGIMAFAARFAEPPRATPHAGWAATDPA